MLSPALACVGLFAAGLIVAIAESLGVFAADGRRLSLTSYLDLAADSEFRASIGLTLGIASVSTAISSLLGLMLALGLRRFPGRTLRTLLQAPLAIPHLAMAFVVVHLISSSGLIARLAFAMGLIAQPSQFPQLINDARGAGIVLTYVLKEMPFVALVVLALLVRIGDEFENVAKTLGASPWQRFRYVLMPLISPAMVSASVFVFAYIMSAFEIPFLLGRQYPAMLSVVAQRRYVDTDLAERPAAIAIAVVLSILSAFLVWIYLRMTRVFAAVEKPMIF